MSNILIIKHGSLGDIAQISGVFRDIRETLKNDKIFILTTFPYAELLSNCPHIDGVLVDKRLPRWNIFYLLKLKRMIEKFNFSQVYDLQNSSRTTFYKKRLLKISNWSSTSTTLKKGEKKDDFDEYPVLERFKIQLDNSNIVTKYTLKPAANTSPLHADKTIVAKWLDTMFDLDKDIASFRDPIELQNVVSNIHGKKMETVVDETETLAIEAPASVDTESDDKSKENLLKEIESLIS